MKKVIFVNKFGPASNAITGRNATELADFLSDNNLEVTFICLQADYKQANKAQDHHGSTYKVRELRSFYKGNSPLLRLINSLFDGFRLWLTSVTRKCDAVIVMTDPPLLFFWFQLFRSFSKRRLFYWTMDLYPEAFVAAKLISESNIIYKFLHKIIYGKPPDLTIVLGNKQLSYLQSKFKHAIPNVVIPCGVVEATGTALDRNKNNNNINGKITFGYGGNVGEAHDADFLILLIQQLDPEKHEMIVSLYGSKAQYVKDSIMLNKSVMFKEYLSQVDISSIDINVATLLPQWHHICVPSKAVTAICCGSALLLNATKDSDAWDMFEGGSWLIESGGDYSTEIKDYLSTLSMESIDSRKMKTNGLAAVQLNNKHEAFSSVKSMIQNI